MILIDAAGLKASRLVNSGSTAARRGEFAGVSSHPECIFEFTGKWYENIDRDRTIALS